MGKDGNKIGIVDDGYLGRGLAITSIVVTPLDVTETLLLFSIYIVEYYSLIT
jgi:hypothetical protein